MSSIERRLAALTADTFAKLLRGVEKEGLRVEPDGTLALTPHPATLGSALTHSHITTDFSESQLELITGVHADPEACVAELAELHQVVYRAIGSEWIWCASMPCRLPDEDAIPIGHYGSSNTARLKSIYRRGLSLRYGRRMQTISGIHYNFSLPDEAWAMLQEAELDPGSLEFFRDRGYFALIRNFRRHSWLLLLLLGSTPAVCGTFLRDRPHHLQRWDTGTYVAPYGTSLRMGPLGYQSDAQASLAVSFNDLSGYAQSLNNALTRSYPPYESLGLRDAEGYRQLTTTLLQLENEFYGTIRPKRRVRRGERPLHALGARGVEYVEVRCIDIDPHLPVGIDPRSMRLIDLFLLHCMLSDSPPDSPREIAMIGRNQHEVAARGRDPELRLQRDGDTVTPADWGRALLTECAPIAEAFDAALGGSSYGDVLTDAMRSLSDFSTLPSARMLRELESDFGCSYPAFVLAHSERHRNALMSPPLRDDVIARYADMAAKSAARQLAIEAEDTLPFEVYRERFLAQDLMSGPHFEHR